MKYASLLFLAVVFFSCAKESTKLNTQPVIETNLSKIQHHWNLVRIIYNEYPTSGIFSDTIHGVVGDYWDFKSDNKCYSFWDTKADTAQYFMVNDSTIKYDGDTFKINKLTATEFEFMYENKQDIPNYDNTVYLSR